MCYSAIRKGDSRVSPLLSKTGGQCDDAGKTYRILFLRWSGMYIIFPGSSYVNIFVNILRYFIHNFLMILIKMSY